MPEIKTLQDYYNPMQSGMQALQYIQGQQHLGLQAQQIQQQGQAVQQQGQNLAIDNAKQAYQAANPMESYPAYAQFAKLSGLPVPDPTKYYANQTMFSDMAKYEPGTPEYDDAFATLMQTDPRSRAAVEKEFTTLSVRRGAQEANVKAGLGGSEDLATLTAEKPAIQTQVGNVVAQTPLQQAQAQALQTKIREHEEVAANVKTQLGVLVPMTKAAGLAIERSMPLVAQLDTIQQEYDKNLKSVGLTKAAAIRQERIAVSPELQQFQQRSLDSLPKIQESVKQMEDLQSQLQTRAELIARGVEPLKEGESLAILAGKVDASTLQLDYLKATMAFAKDRTPTNLANLKTLKAQLDDTVTRLTDQKNSSQESLDIRRDAQQETAQEHRLTREGKANLGKAQAEWQAAGGKLTDAWRFAQKYGVRVDEVKKAAEDPNKPLTQVTIGQEKAEAQTVGKGFGEQYLKSQESGLAAGRKIAKLDRMESLLEGVTTGKLTPTMTDIQAIGESFGIKIDKTLPAKQAFDALASEVALELRNPAGGAGMPGAMSDKDREFLQTMTPGLSRTNEGNKLIIETARKVAGREQQIAKMARAYRKKNGHLDEGFYDELQTYADANPLFAGKTLPQEAAGASTVAPFTDAEKERRYQEFKKSHK